jgi:hypothetical protein
MGDETPSGYGGAYDALMAKYIQELHDAKTEKADMGVMALNARKLQARHVRSTPRQPAPPRIPNSLKRVRRISEAEWEFLKVANAEFVMLLMRNKFYVVGSDELDHDWMNQNFSGLYYYDEEYVVYIETDEDTVLLKMQFEGS